MRRLSAIAACLLLPSCAASSATPYDPYPPQDAPADASSDPSVEAAADVVAEPVLDAPSEPQPDGPNDAGHDVAAEVAFEASSDGSLDGPTDGAKDVVSDIAPEAPWDAPKDVAVDVPKDVAADAPAGPVDPGIYSYTVVPTYSLINPPAVAWHPSADYALVLNNTNTVFRYDRIANSLTQVASTASTLSWRAVQFTPDGSQAVLLGNDNTAKEGRIYLWNHATSQLTDMTAEHFAGGTYEAIAWSPDGSTARLLGAISSPTIARIWTFDVVGGRTDPKAINTSAGCQDLAWATDQFNQPAIAIVCGVNGVTLMHLNAGGQFVTASGNAGNTSRVSGRPQGDYALGVCWSCNSKLYRFQQGAWNSDYGNPLVQDGFQIGFSTDGRRALVLGGTFSGKGLAYEFRHDLFTQNQIYDVSIPNFESPPYNADTSVQLNDLAWRPGCDQGLIVGGSSTVGSQKGYLIQFKVDNGTPCN
jgi:hypothetical protein